MLAAGRSGALLSVNLRRAPRVDLRPGHV